MCAVKVYRISITWIDFSFSMSKLHILSAVILQFQTLVSVSENAARGKPTWQSSTLSGHSPWGESPSAVDGNADPIYYHHSCTHTELDRRSPWWAVDLGQPFDVQRVVVTNRGDCCGSYRRFICLINSRNWLVHNNRCRWPLGGPNWGRYWHRRTFVVWLRAVSATAVDIIIIAACLVSWCRLSVIRLDRSAMHFLFYFDDLRPETEMPFNVNIENRIRNQSGSCDVRAVATLLCSWPRCSIVRWLQITICL